MCDRAGLSFIGVKGQIGIQPSVERLDVVTKVTLCAARMSGAMSMDSDSYIKLKADFYCTGGVAADHLLPYFLNLMPEMIVCNPQNVFVCVYLLFFFHPLLPRSFVSLCRPTAVEMFEPRRLGSLG